MMDESEFQNIADETIEAIQNAIDNSGADLDCDEIGGVLTLEFENGSKIIFSRQAPVKQLWMAAQSGGFHFDYDVDRSQWICDSGINAELYEMLSRLASDQGGVEVKFSS